MSEPAAIARIHKPHGTKGELAVWALVDNPGRSFEPGTVVCVASESGERLAGPLTIVRRRMYHREWLLTFAGIGAREPLEGWRRALLVPNA